METYRTQADANVDHQQQLDLLAALNASDRALRRDECGAWRINGKEFWENKQGGHIYTWGPDISRRKPGTSIGWMLCVSCRSVRQWGAAKKRLAFCTVTQDGDTEGCLRLDHLPTLGEASIIRDILGIRKKREYSDEVLAELRQRAMNLQHGQKSAGGAVPR